MSKSAFARISCACLLALGLAAPVAADPIKFARYPHVAHGKLAFSYHGPVHDDGGRRLAIDAGT